MPTTSPERWARLTDLLGDALERPPAERHAFLAAACADDPTLIPEVERLLAAHEAAAASQRFESGALDLAAEALSLAVPPPRVGPYRLVRELGRGGMGTVWLAERADGLYEQRVAVKLMRAGYLPDEQRRRFRAERRILAGLEHPHIARLLDGGVTDAGQPYLVMEVVEGHPITDYCAARALPLAERLALFRTVCEAIAFAHQNLVVHRDLKPSNIHVVEDASGQPTVKLLDFGIAKLLADDAEDAPYTRTGQALMTPEYAAPEQVQGAAITTATDVYALGVVLYELLVGARPYAIEERSPTAVERAVVETQPTKPSTAVRTAAQASGTPDARLARRLRGDLDTIVLKALRKEPERRYRSAAELADDLRRYAEGLPVEARPDTATYRVRKFVQRHRLGVAAGAALLLALLLGLAGTLWQARVAAAERDRAQLALRDAETTMDFLESVMLQADLEEADPTRPIGAVLDSAARRIDTELAGQAAVAHRVHATMSDIYLGLRDTDRAEHHARRALALAPDSLSYGQSLYLVALALDYRGDDAGALPVYEQAIRVLRHQPDTLAQRRALPQALNGYGTALSDLDRYDEAVAAHQEAAALYERYGDPQLPTSLNNLAAIYLAIGDTDRGIATMERVVAALEARGETDRYEYGVAQINLAIGYANAERPAEAVAQARPAVAALTEALGSTHPETVSARATLALQLERAGRPAEAVREAEALLALVETHPDLIPPIQAYAQVVGGQVLCRHGRPAEGRPALAASLATRRTMVPAGHWVIGSGLSALGECDAALGELARAEQHLREGTEVVQAALGADSPRAQDAADRLRAFCDAHGCTAASRAALEG